MVHASINLQAEKRTIFGKSVNRLRKQSKIPCNIYGKGFESLACTVDYKTFTTAYKSAGETGIVYICIGDQSIPTLINEICYHAITDTILHVDFRNVNLTEKIETEVPVEFTGVSPAESDGNTVLLQKEHLLLKVLPTKIPDSILLDISCLKTVDDQIFARDIPKNEDYEILEEDDDLIVSVSAHHEESEEAVTEVVIPESKHGGAKPEEESK